MKPETALVLGAGFAGLAAAIYLALAGVKVTLLERGKEVGGKAGEFSCDGYRFDTGPSVLTLPHVLEEVFGAAGETLPFAYEPLEPLCRYRFASGRVWEVYKDVERTVAQLDGKEAAAYRRLLREAQRLYEAAAPTFVYGEPPGLAQLARYGLRYGLRAHPGRRLNGLVRGYGVSAELEPFFLRFATYLGADPYRAPAVLHNVMWAELGLGVYYPEGGIKRVVRELAALATRLGVEMVTDTVVTRLLERGGRVAGVQTSRGRLRADTVVSALDIVHTHSLLGRRTLLARREPSLSGFVLLLGVAGVSPLRHHNILFPKDYRAEFDAIRAGRPAEDPTLYVSISSKSDPTHAPPGHENLFVMANAPALPERGGFSWRHEGASYAETLIDRLERRGLELSGRIRLRHLLTPEHLATMGWRGSIYGHAPHSLAAAIKPGQRLRGLSNLVLAGGTVYPGGGIPLALLSGKRAAERALKG